MQVILASVVLWFLITAFLIFLLGFALYLLRRFSPLRDVEGADWARLTAFGLLLPPSLGVVFTIVGLTSALLCPKTAICNYHLCVHSVRHFCFHATALSVQRSHFVLRGALVWCSLTGIISALLMRRRQYIKRIEPSPKLRQAIARANLPPKLTVWETDSDITAGLVGVVSPSILVSQKLVKRLPVTALTSVLHHEYAHWFRRDHWVRFLLFATALIFAPVPFAIWVQKEWREASEKAADDFAANADKNARSLSSALKALHNFMAPRLDESVKQRVERLKAQRSANLKASPGCVTATLFVLALSSFLLCFPPIWLTLHCFAEALMLK
ncbi:MAG: M56 family metallopeptidase [Armatimonadota bacterium]